MAPKYRLFNKDLNFTFNKLWADFYLSRLGITGMYLAVVALFDKNEGVITAENVIKEIKNIVSDLSGYSFNKHNNYSSTQKKLNEFF